MMNHCGSTSNSVEEFNKIHLVRARELQAERDVKQNVIENFL
jgi:hypothetical protein